MNLRSVLLILLCFLVAACEGSDDPNNASDAGASDATVTSDVGASDTEGADATVTSDVGGPDASGPDAGGSGEGVPDVLGGNSWGAADADERILAAAVDSTGHIYVAGDFQDTIDFGGGALSATADGYSGDDDIFLAKLTADGQHVWSKRFGAGSGEHIFAVATDKDDNVTIAGSVSIDSNDQSADFGAGMVVADGVVGTGQAFVASFDSAGDRRWSQSFRSNQSEFTSLAYDGAGNLWVGGHFTRGMEIGGDLRESPDGMAGGASDGIVARFNSAGLIDVVAQITGQEDDEIRDIAWDGTRDQLLVAGSAEEDISVGQTLTVDGKDDIFVAEVDTDGTVSEGAVFGGWDEGFFSEGGALVTVTDGGRRWLAFKDLYDDGSGSQALKLSFVELDDSMAEVTRQDFDVEGVAFDIQTLSAPATGGLLVAGVANQASTDFGGGPLSSGLGAYFLLGLDDDARYSWHIGTEDEAETPSPVTMAGSPSGTWVLAGGFDNELGFTSPALQSNEHSTSGSDNRDAFMVRLSP